MWLWDSNSSSSSWDPLENPGPSTPVFERRLPVTPVRTPQLPIPGTPSKDGSKDFQKVSLLIDYKHLVRLFFKIFMVV